MKYNNGSQGGSNNYTTLLIEQTLAQEINEKSIVWALKLDGIGSALNRVYELNSPELEKCKTREEIAANSAVMQIIMASPEAMATCLLDSVISQEISDYQKLINGYGYSTFNIGDIVKIPTKNFGEVEFDVIGKDHDGAGTITLLTKNILQNKQWHASNLNNYSTSDIRNYLNGSFLTEFEEKCVKAIKPAKKSCHDSITPIVLEDKVWLPSMTEVGLGSYTYAQPEGTDYGFFKTDASRVKKLGTSTSAWWSRTPSKDSAKFACFVYSDGTGDISTCSGSIGVVVGLVF